MLVTCGLYCEQIQMFKIATLLLNCCEALFIFTALLAVGEVASTFSAPRQLGPRCGLIHGQKLASRSSCAIDINKKVIRTGHYSNLYLKPTSLCSN